MARGSINTLDPIEVNGVDLESFPLYINREFDKLSANGIAVIRPTTSANGRKIEQTILAWSKDQLAQSGASWKQTVDWDKSKGCGVMLKEETPEPLNLLRYYRSQRTHKNGSDYPYPLPQDCKTIKQLASACQQDTLWPTDTWNEEAVEKEEKSVWESMSDPTVPRYYEQERNLIFDRGQPISPDLGNLGDLLDALKKDPNVQDFEGINTPYAYFGGRNTLFGFHREDFDFLSINKMLFGAPKIWYAIPSSQAELFEKVLQELFPNGFKKCPLWFRLKLAVIDPETLVKHGINVTRVVQYPGDVVVTFPLGWHAGFNLGFNCAEAVNFVVDRWIPYGVKARVCRCSQAFYGWSLIARAFAEKGQIHLGAHIRSTMGIA